VIARRGTALQKKRAIRLLILVVIAFAVLLLPIHIHLLVGLTVGPLEEKYQWYEVRAGQSERCRGEDSGFRVECCGMRSARGAVPYTQNGP